MGKQHEEKEKRKERKKEKKEKEQEKKNLCKLTGLLHYCTLLLKEFLLFLPMPIPVEMVTPVRTMITICLMVSFAVHTFEDMRTQHTNLGG